MTLLVLLGYGREITAGATHLMWARSPNMKSSELETNLIPHLKAVPINIG